MGVLIKRSKCYLFSCEKFRKDFGKIIRNKKRVEAICFIINSPGGSAVYSNIISITIKNSQQIIKLN
mgnify:CR=1 FL=1